MFNPRIKITRDLYERVRKCSESAGYSSVEEFVAHALEREVDRLSSDQEDKEHMKRRLRGLGYIS